ncbi:MAG: ABC transporter substrate-binding protein [Thermoanaerobaculia bacterium]
MNIRFEFWHWLQILPGLACGAKLFLRAALALAMLIAGLTAPLVAEEMLVSTAPVGRPGGRLVVALRAEPKTLNPLFAADAPSLAVIRRTVGDLVHINRWSQRTEAAVAKSWTVSPDGRTVRLELRQGLRFSDGHLVDAADVLFSYQLFLDEELGSPYRALLMVNGKPLEVQEIDHSTIEFHFSQPQAAGLRVFDSFAILPEHLLRPLYEAGKVSEAWNLTTPPAEMAGLGPYRLKEYRSGERVVLERNPYYWKMDVAGTRLPYINELIFIFVPTEDSQVIRFQSGETDLIDRIGARNFKILAATSESGTYRMADLGPGLAYEFLFFNHNDLSSKNLPAIQQKQSWMNRLEFRQAISVAIDRKAIVRLVYDSLASPLATHVSAGHKYWRNAQLKPTEHDPQEARRLLGSIGFSWDEQGTLLDAEREPIEFSIITNSSNPQRIDTATLIQEDLRQIGIRIQVVPLEFRSLLGRVLHSQNYEACLLGLRSGDADPNPDLNVWLSDGPNHLWNLGQERAFGWEVELDRLLKGQVGEMDASERKRMYDRVQELLAENLPVIFLVSPRVLVGAKSGIENFRPAVLDHSTLWNVEELYWREEDG